MDSGGWRTIMTDNNVFEHSNAVERGAHSPMRVIFNWKQRNEAIIKYSSHHRRLRVFRCHCYSIWPTQIYIRVLYTYITLTKKYILFVVVIERNINLIMFSFSPVLVFMCVKMHVWIKSRFVFFSIGMHKKCEQALGRAWKFFHSNRII